MVNLIPKYRSVLKSQQPVKRSIPQRTDTNIDILRDCFDETDWTVFTDSCEDLIELSEHVAGYVRFCENIVIPNKDVICYPNTKPWVTKELKEIIVKKRKTFLDKTKAQRKEMTREEIKKINYEVDRKIKDCMNKFKSRMEDCVRENNPRAQWDCMKAMAGCKGKSKELVVSEDVNDYVNRLNEFYARFDVNDFSDEKTHEHNHE